MSALTRTGLRLRVVATLACMVVASVAGTLAGAAEPAAPVQPEPSTYALVSAVGSAFNLVHQVRAVDSKLPPFRRDSVRAPDQLLDRLALKSLDDAVTRREPSAKRVHVTVAAGTKYRSVQDLGEEELIAEVVRELRNVPDRSRWTHLIVVTPATRVLAVDGMPSRTGGMGVYSQPIKSLPGRDSTPVSNPTTGETVDSDVFVAPFAHLTVWSLDPKTFAVIGRHSEFRHSKHFDQRSALLEMGDIVNRQYLAKRVVGVVEDAVLSAAAGLDALQPRGKVEIRELPPK